ncbi:MAG: GNAT family N-acetyltransferase [Abitibacteriaceae bacterium]|nr:GNAT family N-acetyltransferase [Abditibacteriaceae bacterium]
MNVTDVFGNLPTLETDRLRLRKISLRDARDFFEYASNPEVTRHSTWSPHESIEDTKQFINQVLNQYKAGHVAPWGIEHKADRKFIGTCGFGNWIHYHARAEIGYALARPYWSQGYMTEAVQCVIAFGFKTMKLNRIEARCRLENIGSFRVMEKAGMAFEGVLRQHMYMKGDYHDLKLYAILHADFLNQEHLIQQV